MKRLDPNKLHVQREPGTGPDGPVVPRCYTLTHSDQTGELYLTIGPEHNSGQVSGWYTRLMRDEVLAEWEEAERGPILHVHCHVSGGLAFGLARWRDAIFRRELPLVLEAFRYADQRLYDAHPELRVALISVHLHAVQSRYNRIESWGTPDDYL